MRAGQRSYISAFSMACRQLLSTGIMTGLLLAAWPCFAQQLPDVLRSAAEKQIINQERIGLVSGLPGGTYARLGTEMSQLVESEAAPPPFRVVVQIGSGSVRNLDDLLNLRGVDLALLQSDVVEAYAAAGQRSIYDERRRSMRIVATLHREEIHILSHAPFTDLASLSGHRVNVGTRGSGTNMTARTLLSRLNVQPVLDEGATTQARNRLMHGELDAVFYVVGKGADYFRGISYEDATKADLRFIAIPESQPGIDEYVPARLSHDDYPLLVEEGRPVETRAVTALLAIYAWAPGDRRYQAANRFIDRFFRGSAKLVAPEAGYSRAQWCQANLAGSVPGWQRFELADRWLAQNRNVVAALRNVPGSNCPAADVPAGCEARFIDYMRHDGMIVSTPFSAHVRRIYDDWRPRNNC